jgi:hypothetical protein
LDVAKNDFFEHIDPARLSDYVAPTPEPTATPMPTAESAQTAASTAQPTQVPRGPKLNNKQIQQLRGISIIAFVVLATGALIGLKKLEQRKNGK